MKLFNLYNPEPQLGSFTGFRTLTVMWDGNRNGPPSATNDQYVVVLTSEKVHDCKYHETQQILAVMIEPGTGYFPYNITADDYVVNMYPLQAQEDEEAFLTNVNNNRGVLKPGHFFNEDGTDAVPITGYCGSFQPRTMQGYQDLLKNREKDVLIEIFDQRTADITQVQWNAVAGTFTYQNGFFNCAFVFAGDHHWWRVCPNYSEFGPVDHATVDA